MSNHPNVLLICTDHWPGLLTRPNGHRTVMTPTLERFSRNVFGVSRLRSGAAQLDDRHVAARSRCSGQKTSCDFVLAWTRPFW